jgi:hypothetical protein
MTQQISMEDAFPTFQRKTTELFEANMLLQAQIDVQGREIAALREENERLKNGEPAPEAPAGPNLAAAPPYQPGSDRD